MDSSKTDLHPVEGIILAAGLSQRAGRFKMALPLGEKAIIQRAVEGMLPFVARVYVVVGWQAERVEQLLSGYARVETALNRAYAEGMFSSVRAGAARIAAARFFLQPGDIAMVAPSTYRALLAASGEAILPTYGGRRGHPILLSSSLIPEILAAPAEVTLRDVLRRRTPTLVAVEDEGILYDVDTPEDYQAMLGRLNDPTRGDDELNL